jgi:hypothetical protein
MFSSFVTMSLSIKKDSSLKNNMVADPDELLLSKKSYQSINEAQQ